MKPIGANRIIQIIAIILVLSGCVVTISCNGLSSGSAANSGSTKPAGASSYSISGTITPAANASGVTLTLSGTAKATATVNSSGNYSFSGLANGSYTITPSKSGFVFAPSKQTITVSSADVAGMDFGSAPAQLWSIQGTVTPAGGAGGTTVTLSGASDAITTADASGNYVFSDLGSGSYIVTPAENGVTFTPYSQNAVI
ncbi:MAG: carboxypeptidase regulatory-like domain-containing protein, partial [Terriglobales bacterium]